MTAIPTTHAAGAGRTDAELARAAAAGDRRAFAGIYDRYADRLHDFCIGMLRDRDSAADCVQDTFCTAAVNLTNLREPDKLRPWLYSIARHEALRKLRERSRERPSDELPEAASREAGPNTLAHRMELADLIAEAAGGLSDRDREVLELSYRHGLDGPELAQALGVSRTNAGTLVHRLRDTVERCLGALLVSRRVQSNPAHCPQLAAILHGWDGHFTVLIRKRVSRHIESCSGCDRERRRLVNPVALLGGAPVLIPAPGWLRDRTMRDVQLTSSASGMATTLASRANYPPNDPYTNTFQDATESVEEQSKSGSRDADARRRLMLLVALLIAVPVAALGVVIAWLYAPSTPVAPIGETATSATPVPTPVGPPATGATSATRPQPGSATRTASPGTTATVTAPNATRTATVPSTPQPSAQAPVPVPTPLPNQPAPTPPIGDMQAPPTTPGPAPQTTYAPPPPEPAPADQFPPLQTYDPGLPYTEPTLVPPN